MSHLIIFDSECALCDRMVRFLLQADGNGSFRFAPLGGETAAPALKRWFPQGDIPDTVILVEFPGTSNERIWIRSDVMIRTGELLDGMYRAFLLLKLVPRPIRDALYRLVARNRKSIFGTVASCPFFPGRPNRFLP